MKFSATATLITIGAVILSGAMSASEGTLTNKRVTLGFLNHGGMWGDIILLSVMAGLVIPHAPKRTELVVVSLLTALALTIPAHAIWGRAFRQNGITGHMFPNHQRGTWY